MTDTALSTIRMQQLEDANRSLLVERTKLQHDIDDLKRSILDGSHPNLVLERKAREKAERILSCGHHHSLEYDDGKCLLCETRERNARAHAEVQAAESLAAQHLAVTEFWQREAQSVQANAEQIFERTKARCKEIILSHAFFGVTTPETLALELDALTDDSKENAK